MQALRQGMAAMPSRGWTGVAADTPDRASGDRRRRTPGRRAGNMDTQITGWLGGVITGHCACRPAGVGYTPGRGRLARHGF